MWILRRDWPCPPGKESLSGKQGLESILEWVNPRVPATCITLGVKRPVVFHPLPSALCMWAVASRSQGAKGHLVGTTWLHLCVLHIGAAWHAAPWLVGVGGVALLSAVITMWSEPCLGMFVSSFFPTQNGHVVQSGVGQVGVWGRGFWFGVCSAWNSQYTHYICWPIF